MGAIATASCECGYATSFLIGGGMFSFQTVCLFPVYCRACRCLGCPNLIDALVVCGECGGSDVVAYDAPELLGEAGVDEVFSWNLAEKLGRELRLCDGQYFCPSCQQMLLRFEHIGCWD